MSEIKKRDLSLDYMKGVLIFLVVWGHLLQFCFRDVGSDYLHKFIYSFHMPLFVFISGWFFKANANTNFLSMVKKQGQRLLIPQFVFVLLGFLFYALFWDVYSYKLMNEGMLSIKQLYHFITFAWYLWCIFFCSLIVTLGLNFFKKYAIYFWGVMCIIMWLAVDFLPGPIFNNQQVARMLPCFLLGMYANRYQDVFFKNKKILIAICACVSFVYWGIFVFDPEKILPGYLIRIPLQFFPMLLAFFSIKWLYAKSVIKRLFLFWGRDTLFIYVCHSFIIALLGPLHIKFSLGNMFLNYLFFGLISIIVCFVLGLLGQKLRKWGITRRLVLGEK